jgi:hypothetical protein
MENIKTPPATNENKSQQEEKTLQENITTENKKPWKRIIFLVVLIGLFAGLGAFWELYLANPKRILAEAGKKFEDTDSLVTQYSSPKENAIVSLRYFKEKEKLSQFNISIKDIMEEDNHNLNLNFRMNANDLYFLPEYSQMEQIEKEIENVFPPLIQTQTYQLSKPVLFGEKWLYTAIPQSEDEETEEDRQISQQAEDQLTEDFLNTMKFKKKDPLAFLNPTGSKTIYISFKKDALVEFIDSLKDYDLDVEVSQINSIIRIVESTDDWNKNLITIKINSKNQITEIDLKFPHIPEDVLKESVDQSIEEEQELENLYENFEDQIDNFLKNVDDDNELNHLGTITFSDYNNADPVKKPLETVNLDLIAKAAEKELAPLLMGFLNQQMNPSQFYQPQPPKISPRQINPNNEIYNQLFQELQQ